MTDFAQHIAAHKDLSEKEQKKSGMPLGGTMEEEHRNFLTTVDALIDSGEIDPYDPQTFLKRDVYDHLDQEWKDKTDLTLFNMSTLLRQIYDFYKSTETPNEAPQYQTMIEALWRMKQTIEEQYDVFKF